MMKKELEKINSIRRNLGDTTIKKLLKTAVVLVDTREQENAHILSYLQHKKIPYKRVKQNTGDYSIMLPVNEELGIFHDIYIRVAIERKGSLDEIVGNLSQDRTRLENELIRSKSLGFTLLIEDARYKDILNHRYRSRMTELSVVASLMSFKARYNFNLIFLDKEESPAYIYHSLVYELREALKQL